MLQIKEKNVKKILLNIYNSVLRYEYTLYNLYRIIKKNCIFRNLSEKCLNLGI